MQVLGVMETDPDEFMMDCPQCARVKDESNNQMLAYQTEIEGLHQQIANLEQELADKKEAASLSGEISGISHLEQDSETPSTFSSLATGQVKILQQRHEDQIAGLTGLVHSMKQDLDSVRLENKQMLEQALRQNIESLTKENTELKSNMETLRIDNSKLE